MNNSLNTIITITDNARLILEGSATGRAILQRLRDPPQGSEENETRIDPKVVEAEKKETEKEPERAAETPEPKEDGESSVGRKASEPGSSEQKASEVPKEEQEKKEKSDFKKSSNLVEISENGESKKIIINEKAVLMNSDEENEAEEKAGDENFNPFPKGNTGASGSNNSADEGRAFRPNISFHHLRPRPSYVAPQAPRAHCTMYPKSPIVQICVTSMIAGNIKTVSGTIDDRPYDMDNKGPFKDFQIVKGTFMYGSRGTAVQSSRNLPSFSPQGGKKKNKRTAFITSATTQCWLRKTGAPMPRCLCHPSYHNPRVGDHTNHEYCALKRIGGIIAEAIWEELNLERLEIPEALLH